MSRIPDQFDRATAARMIEDRIWFDANVPDPSIASEVKAITEASPIVGDALIRSAERWRKATALQALRDVAHENIVKLETIKSDSHQQFIPESLLHLVDDDPFERERLHVKMVAREVEEIKRRRRMWGMCILFAFGVLVVLAVVFGPGSGL